MPGPVLRIFCAEFVQGESALRILIVGMIVPVMVGTVGFILIMAGRTGWDLLVYVGGFALDVGLALALARPEALGIRGAAIAQAATLTFSAFARLVLVRRFLDIWPFDGAYLRLVVPTLIGGSVMAGAHAFLPDAKWLVNLLLSAAVGTGAYAVAVFAIGLKPNERSTALRMAGRVVGKGRAAA
jgi:O-antigen/teichoic acid export membrane protein